MQAYLKTSNLGGGERNAFLAVTFPCTPISRPFQCSAVPGKYICFPFPQTPQLTEAFPL